MNGEALVSAESVRPQDRVTSLMGRAFQLRQQAELGAAVSTLEEALAEARKTPYDIEFQTRIQLAMSLADTYQAVGEVPKAVEMLAAESAFAEKVSQIIQASGTPNQKRSATGGFLQVRDRSVQMGLLGKEAPEIAVKEWLQGGVASLNEVRGRVVILEFWATWCKPCQEMFPKLKKLHAAEQEKGLEVIALTRHYLAYGGSDESLAEERQLMQTMVNQHEVAFHVGIAGNEQLQATFGANGLPTIVLVDREGTVRYAGPGEDDLIFNKELQHSLKQ